VPPIKETKSVSIFLIQLGEVGGYHKQIITTMEIKEKERKTIGTGTQKIRKKQEKQHETRKTDETKCRRDRRYGCPPKTFVDDDDKIDGTRTNAALLIEDTEDEDEN